jgi:hypothetical protein
MGKLIALICPTAEEEIFFGVGLDRIYRFARRASVLARRTQLSPSFPGAQLRT